MPFYNSVRGVLGPQGLKSSLTAIGTLSNPATNGVQLYDSGLRTSGLYYITTSTGVKQVYVDLVTTDAVTNKAGWMLAGSWGTAWSWTLPSTTSTAVFADSAQNCFSANFGTMPISFVRPHVSSSISASGTSATSCDFYHYNSTPTNWREWWVTGSGNGTYQSTTTNKNAAGTTVSIPRDAFKQFTHSYNLKYSYQVNQNWNNLADPTGTQGDWWNGLNGTATSIGWHNTTDGSFAILPQGSTSTGCGQDCDENQTKFGADDATANVPNVAYFGATATANMAANIGTSGSNTNFWLWIK
jgi:hypothetical protein